MTPELAHWILAGLGAIVVAVVGAVVTLLVFAFRVGRFHHAIEALEKEVRRLSEAHADEIRRLEEREERFDSDWSEIKEKVTTLWEKVFSLSRWRDSRTNED